jgi:hypothetical protein
MSGDQLSRAELENMSPGEVAKAHRDGRLDELLAGNDPGKLPLVGSGADQGARGRRETLRESLRHMPADEIRRLRREGALDGLLRGDE